MANQERRKMQILFEPKYSIGDVVVLKINPEKKMVVDGYKINMISEAGEVIQFVYGLYDGDGSTYTYSDIDLELIEEVRS